MSFEFPRLATASADALSTASLAPVLNQTSLTTSIMGLERSSQSLLFVDANVSDYQGLLTGVAPGTEVHVLDSSQDAVTQITNTLLGRQNIASLHIVSHGEAGELNFGSSALNLTDLPQYVTQIQSWSKALTNDADILLYGCNVAEGELGQAFIKIISQLTGADVAASDNLTGSKALGGDWVLESKTGAIETGLIFDPATLTSYSGVFTPTSPTNSGFETGDLTGWTVQTLTSPNWSTTQTATVVSSDKNQGTYSAKISISGSVATGGGTAYGPTITSSYFQGDAGDKILFDWKALRTSDYYDIRGEIVNDSTGQRVTVISEIGTLRDWTTTSVILPSSSSSWKFVFTAGSYDATFGGAVGSTLYIDNIRVVIPAPTLNTSASPTLSSTVEDISAPTNGLTTGATLVSALIDNSATAGGLDNFTNPGGSPGLAVTGVNGGTLYYTTDGGSTWTALGAPSTTAGLLLAANSNTYVYFKPNANVNGSISDAVTFKAWNGFDGTNGQANVNTTTNGGVSSQSDTASISITPLNDAPTGSVSIAGTIQENAILTASNTLADADGLGTVTYQWQQSTDGTNWSNISGAINATLTLNNAQSGKFVRTQASYTDQQGTAETIASAATASRIANVNDAPTLTGNATLTATNQNATNPSGSNLTSLFGSLFDDPDTGSSLSGLAIVSNPANSTQGQWQYSIDSTNWTNVGTVADGATALALSASTLVRFVPATSYKGTPPGLTVRALDDTYSNGFTSGTTRVTVNTTSNGGTTAISGGPPVALNTSVTESLPNLLWRNSGSGENAVWQLNSFALQSSYYLPNVPDPNWQIASSNADFNSDGIADILWRNQATGENAIWEMNNTGLQSKSYINSVADVNWQIVGTGDFDSDGKSDVLWRNKASGANAIWEMSGAVLKNGYYINSVADVNWQIVGTGDFDGDGKSDILWRNKASGANAIWEMSGAVLKSNYYISSLADLNWEIAGAANFGSDRTPDILWRNKQAGKVMIWKMSSVSSTQVSYAQTYDLMDVVDPKWSVKPFVSDLDLDAVQSVN